MTPIKAYTDLSQSKTLSKILLIESADFMWEYDPDKETYWNKPTMIPIDSYIFVNDIPCWSLTALLELMPIGSHIEKKNSGYACYVVYTKPLEASTPIEAAFEMVCWLIKQGYIKVKK